MDNKTEEDRRKDGIISSNVTWKSYDLLQSKQTIVTNGEQPVWLSLTCGIH